VVMFRAMARCGVLFLLCSLPIAAFAAQPFGIDLDGHPVDQLAPPGARAIVLFFTASDCPISSRYIPEIERLDRQFTPDGVRLWWVYPNPDDTPELVRRHQQQFHIDGHVILDNDQRLTRIAHVTITPEVAVLIPAGATFREVYRGRIDDRYLALGRERPFATRHDLEDSVRAILAGRPIPEAATQSVGCSIVPRNEP
jgi:Redoxin